MGITKGLQVFYILQIFSFKVSNFNLAVTGHTKLTRLELHTLCLCSFVLMCSLCVAHSLAFS